MWTLAALIGAAFCFGCNNNGKSIQLFNGYDLTGWQAEGKAVWTVEDGAIVGQQGPGNGPGDLLTEQCYKDFDLSCRWRAEWPCNSGIWFRYQSADQAYQADILEFTAPVCYSGTLFCTGKMFLAMNTDASLVNREGWNTFRIRAVGDHLQVWLNGRQVADMHDDTSTHGRIGIQVHAGEKLGPMKIMVKDVKLTVLD